MHALETAAQQWLETLSRRKPSAVDAEDLRVSLESGVNGLLNSLSAVKERLNELTLPFLLPPELLAHVFSFLAYPDAAKSAFTGERRAKAWSWTAVTHVCRRWRRTAISTPSLWTRLSPDMRPPWEVFLDRAKDAPLKIDGFNQYNASPFHFRLIHGHRHHIHTLVLTGLNRADTCDAVACLIGSLPMLETLLIKPKDAYDDPPELPPNFLSDVAPRLRELTLVGVRFPWDTGSALLKTFRHDVRPRRFRNHQPSPAHPTLSTVLRTLQQMPALETLVLEIYPPAGSVDSLTFSHGSNTVSLLNLRALRLASHDDSCWHLWSRLRMPPTAILSICAMERNQPIALIADLLRRCVLASPLPNFSSIDVSFSESREPGKNVVIKLGKGAHQSTYSDPGYQDTTARVRFTEPVVVLDICTDRHANDMVVREILRDVHFDNIRILSISLESNAPWDSTVFYDTFLRLRSVTTFKLFGMCAAAASICAALVPISPPEPGSSFTSGGHASEIIFPALEELDCFRVDFSTSARNRTGHELLGRDALTQMLERRVSWFGMRLRKLGIRACQISNEEVDVWEKYVRT
ncbi:unnamed protein product [Peniophora sp. CBMAI 1063]|nr:unnamed protein product [Peniophora sp. CBMAI 1063]